ncbi:hypothetical protein [Spiroplasma endosymbiont of Lariophagus distinguendus]|uniref:hypothetical protein n=1 Tax=Spiroplasma endosymbiont of Lariophagus distinguendus TaxID=2935082 RepID=UPI00207AC8CB|nr:hypothetical protein [Spiroplasma endosymbiont of Lariophagus distinguendus]
MKPDKLISNNTINHNSNSILENSSIKSENNHTFDSSIRNTVNQQNAPSTSSNHNWDKIKCLRTSPHMYLWRKQWNWMSSTILFKQNKIVWNI